MKSEYEQAGFRFDAGGHQGRAVAEAVALIKGLLKGEQVTLGWSALSRDRPHDLSVPAQRPHPPILIGGNGRSSSPSLRGEADIVGFWDHLPPRRNASTWIISAMEGVRTSIGECSS